MVDATLQECFSGLLSLVPTRPLANCTFIDDFMAPLFCRSFAALVPTRCHDDLNRSCHRGGTRPESLDRTQDILRYPVVLPCQLVT